MGTVLSSEKYTPEGIPYYTYDDFKGLDRVGQGQYSTVKKGYYNRGSYLGPVAVKEFHVLDEYSDREIQLLKGSSHPNIIATFGVIWNGKYASSTRKPYFGYVMEYMELGSLDDRIYDFSKNYDDCLISKWIQQIGAGVQYLHKRNIIHRDIKPPNILLASLDHLKLADFGLARVVSGRDTNTAAFAGTGLVPTPTWPQKSSSQGIMAEQQMSFHLGSQFGKLYTENTHGNM